VSHRSFRSTLIPVAAGLAAIVAVSWPASAVAVGYARAGDTVQASEWWLSGLHVKQAWPSAQGAGITVAVLGTGVDPRHPDLAGSVTTGPDFSGSGRKAGGPFWGVNGTEVAGIIAGHGHGTGHMDGVLGIAPAAKILSIRVTLEYNDPLNSDQALARKLPGAIAAGITYAVDHGARIIELPMDPGTGGLTGQGNPAAAGGSQAEQAAVANALSKDVVLVGPAGDDGQGAGRMDYPAAYPGVIAVGSVARDGQIAPFSSRHTFVTLSAPGVSLTAATPPAGYAPVSSTSMSSGIVAGVAALVLSRFPHLTGAQVSQVLTQSVTQPRTHAAGAGLGTIDAARAVSLAAGISGIARPTATPAPSHKPQRMSTTAAHQASGGSVASSLIRYVVAGLGVLIALLVVLLLLMRSRREKARAAAAAAAAPARARTRGQHEQRKPEPPAGAVLAITGSGGTGRPRPPQPVPGIPGSPPASPGSQGPAATWTATGGFTGGGLGEMQSPASEPSAPGAPFRPAMSPPPKPAKTGKGTRQAGDAGPPWAPAPAPERTFGTLPATANTALPPDPGPGIRVPRDMTDLPAVPPDAMLPAPFEFGTSPDPDFPPRPRAGQGDDFPDVPPSPVQLPTRPSLGFAAAPVPVDYAPPQAPDFTVPSRAAGLVLSAGTAGAAGTDAVPAAPAESRAPGSKAADPSFIWNLSGTDVFPTAERPDEPEAPEAPGTVPQDDDPGASAG
jgi:hypothetical protein